VDVRRYQDRVSGPLLDRFDLRVDLAPVPWADISGAGTTPESTELVRARVVEARNRQIARQGGLNSELKGRALRQYCQPSSRTGLRLLERAVEHLLLSVRGVHRVLRVARTAADLEGAVRVTDRHVAEALHFRMAGGPGRTP
jgi:magnesium chelatase family protein